VRRRSQLVFLLLVLVQAAHSVEEYATHLYLVFAPARFVSGLVSDDLATGFAVVNAALVAFGLWCWLVPVRRGAATGRVFAWPWAMVELANGLGHCGLAVAAGGYFPGALTAPALIAVSAWLAALLAAGR
jgi:uncharacterized protein with HXXEE motif